MTVTALAQDVAPRPLRAGIYDRVSDDRQGKSRSVQQQNEGNRAACEDNRWTVYDTYADPDRSASRFATKVRENWKRLLADLAAGRIDVLVIWESSRGDRKLATWAELLDTCRDNGVLIHVTSHHHTYDVRRRRDYKTLAEDGIDNADESEKLSERVRRGMADSRSQGRPHGRIPYGYERIYNEKNKELVEQRAKEPEATIVREIFTRVASGDPIIAVATDLNAGRVKTEQAVRMLTERPGGVPSPTGKRWARDVVRRIALNYIYVGKREFGGEILDGKWEELVDEETFHAARRVLTDPSRRTTRPGRSKYLLSYLARCGCGSWLLVVPAHKPGRRPYYRCERGCTSMVVEWLDEHVTGVICARLSSPQASERLTRHDDTQVLAARAEAATLRGRLDEFRLSAARGETSPASLARIEGELLPQVEAAERRAIAATVPVPVRDLIDGDGDIRAAWDAMSVAARREVVRTMVEVRLHPVLVPGRNQRFDPEKEPDRVEIVRKTK